MLAALFVLLHRYTGRTDIVIGTASSARDKLAFEDLIGFFANTLALRCDLSGNPYWEAFLDGVVESTWDALDHQNLPFDRVVEALQPERTLSHNPLFQILFVMPSTSGGQLELQDLALTPIPVDTGTAKFDLSWFVHDLGEHLEVRLEYDTDLFDRPSIQRMSEHFLRLLVAISEEPGRRIGDFPLLTEQERRTLLVEWNDTACEFPRGATVDRLFEAQALLTPDAMAVEYQGIGLSYASLNARADCLAASLRALGVRAGGVVGICLERSVDTVIAVLGVLKAGGAYLALDPSYPSLRLAAMAEDASPRVLILHRRHGGLLPEMSAAIGSSRVTSRPRCAPIRTFSAPLSRCVATNRPGSRVWLPTCSRPPGRVCRARMHAAICRNVCPIS